MSASLVSAMMRKRRAPLPSPPPVAAEPTLTVAAAQTPEPTPQPVPPLSDPSQGLLAAAATADVEQRAAAPVATQTEVIPTYDEDGLIVSVKIIMTPIPAPGVAA